ncbi:hypothetical protein VNO77_18178 [Canavalia gladiata]|uniref:Uncharacterized protein n=1 Tax=Canavalia gladiata TaxID=3824 RepID=A0AAN9QK30_CANGL
MKEIVWLANSVLQHTGSPEYTYGSRFALKLTALSREFKTHFKAGMQLIRFHLSRKLIYWIPYSLKGCKANMPRTCAKSPMSDNIVVKGNYVSQSNYISALSTAKHILSLRIN